MTVYRVANSNSVDLDIQHVIANASGFSYTFRSRVPANSVTTYHLRDIAQVPSPFQGSVTLSADLPFAAEIVGYDYPGAVTPTPGP